MTEYLTGAALYRAMADMLDGGREVQMLYAGQDDWRRATNVTTYCAYRLKPVEKRTVTIGYKNSAGVVDWKTLVAPEVECPATGSTVWLLGNDHVPLKGFQHNDCTEQWLKDGALFLTLEDSKAMSDWLTKCRLGQT